MKLLNKLFLDANRHHLTTIPHGYVIEIDEREMRKVMIEEFEPTYGVVDPTIPNTVFRLVEKIYEYYDKWLLEEEMPEERDKARFGDHKEPELKFIQPERRQW